LAVTLKAFPLVVVAGETESHGVLLALTTEAPIGTTVPSLAPMETPTTWTIDVVLAI
jgi:hypothetical protein